MYNVFQSKLTIWQRMCAVLSCFSCVSATLWTAAHEAPLSMEFSRQEYWSGLLCPPPGNLPNPGMDSISLTSELTGLFFNISATWQRVLRGKKKYD